MAISRGRALGVLQRVLDRFVQAHRPAFRPHGGERRFAERGATLGPGPLVLRGAGDRSPRAQRLAERFARSQQPGGAVVLALARCQRAAAFDACRYVIDTLKLTIPIWKKEVWEGDEVWIEGEGEAPASLSSR